LVAVITLVGLFLLVAVVAGRFVGPRMAALRDSVSAVQEANAVLKSDLAIREVREAALADTVRQLRGDSAELAQDLRGTRFALRGARLNRDSVKTAIEDSVIQNLPPDIRALLAAEERVADEAQAEAAACDASLANCEHRARLHLARFLVADSSNKSLVALNVRAQRLIAEQEKALHPNFFEWLGRDLGKKVGFAAAFFALGLIVK
jgi:hypothetical protein